MFYCKKFNPKELRFGDVIVGQHLYSLDLNDKSSVKDFKLKVNLHKYDVVLTPCCSIRDNNIIVTPLIPIQTKFFLNPFFEEDLLRINKINKPHNYIPPQEWERKSDEEKNEISAREECYTLTDLFIYDRNDLFDSYPLVKYNPQTNEKTKIYTNYYMIDFKNVYNIKLDTNNKSDNYLTKSKVLELSRETRIDLNHKLKAFYRIAEEDLL